MRKARGAVCADAAKARSPRARARSAARKVFISSLHERPAADVEILAHGHVHEPARAAQRPRDVALALHVLGEDEVSGQAQGAMAVARLELEDARGEENQLTPRSIVKIPDMAFGGLAEKNRVAAEGFRRGPFALGHRHLADFDRRVSRVLREYPHDAHTGGTIGLKDHAPSLAQGLFRREPRPGKARIIGVRGQLATGPGVVLAHLARVGKGLPPFLWTTSRKHFATLESKPSLSEEAGRNRICIHAGRTMKSRGTRRGIATLTSEGNQDVHTVR